MEVDRHIEEIVSGPLTLRPRGALTDPGLTLPAAPAVYRFVFCPPDAEPRAYVGQTENLRCRMSRVRNPGPSEVTNQRLRELTDDVTGAGGEVLLETLDLDRLETPYLRQALENLALLAHHGRRVRAAEPLAGRGRPLPPPPALPYFGAGLRAARPRPLAGALPGAMPPGGPGPDAPGTSQPRYAR